jgi:FHS family L-fucose permease-like MFS transporter
MVGRFLGSAILQKISAQKVLFISALASVLLLSITILTNGYISMWSMLAVGLFNSIMWSNIFALSIDGLGKYTNKASGILVMAPVGGAIFPMLQGMLADMPAIGLHMSYILPLLCYGFIIYYALVGYKPVDGELEKVEA